MLVMASLGLLNIAFGLLDALQVNMYLIYFKGIYFLYLIVDFKSNIHVFKNTSHPFQLSLNWPRGVINGMNAL